MLAQSLQAELQEVGKTIMRIAGYVIMFSGFTCMLATMRFAAPLARHLAELRMPAPRIVSTINFYDKELWLVFSLGAFCSITMIVAGVFWIISVKQNENN